MKLCKLQTVLRKGCRQVFHKAAYKLLSCFAGILFGFNEASLAYVKRHCHTYNVTAIRKAPMQYAKRNCHT